MSLLYGLHDEEGIIHVPNNGWCLDLIALNSKPKPKTYDARLNWLVRLDWGYDGAGTIPNPEDLPTYFQNLLGFVTGTTGVWGYIIGNEPNHQQEWPSGDPIEETRYCAVFIHAYDLVKKISSDIRVSLAAIAPYQLSSIPYWNKILNLCIASSVLPDFLSLHTYTRGSNPTAINADLPMDAPLQHCQSGFLAYKDFLNFTPATLIDKPAIITEFDEYEAWEDKNTGVVRAAYENINYHNQFGGLNKVLGLLLYRYPKKDKWFIEGKRGVIEDFQAAVGKGYTSPTMGATTMPDNTTFIPAVSTGIQAPALPPRQIDPRAIARGVKVKTPALDAGTKYWFAKNIRWIPESESGGRHHIYGNCYIDGQKKAGINLRVGWGGDHTDIHTEDKSKDTPPWDYWYNYPMSPSLNDYWIQVLDAASETVYGIGMGADGNSHVHTSTVVEWELVTMPEAQQPAPTNTTPLFVNSPKGANLRAEPNTKAAIILGIPYAEQVDSFGTEITAGAVWNHVTASTGQQGWILGALLSPTAPGNPGPTPVTPPVPVPTSGVIIEPRVAQALIKVESGGQSNNGNGTPIIRFESHIFRQFLKNDALWEQYFSADPDKPWAMQQWRSDTNSVAKDIHTGKQADEYAAFEFAKTLNADAAYNAISMGAPQIMGFNHERIGYSTAEAMFVSFKSAMMQIIGFLNFCLSDPTLAQAMHDKDWRTVAAKYNGSGAIDSYSKLLREAYESLGG